MTNFYKATDLSPVADHETLTVSRSHRPKNTDGFFQAADRRPSGPQTALVESKLLS